MRFITAAGVCLLSGVEMEEPWTEGEAEGRLRAAVGGSETKAESEHMRVHPIAGDGASGVEVELCGTSPVARKEEPEPEAMVNGDGLTTILSPELVPDAWTLVADDDVTEELLAS
jgi:hypothetical protein